MEKSNSFFKFINQLTPTKDQNQKTFNSMKEFFHHHFKNIKSENLLSYISPKNKLNSSKKEYSSILKQKKKKLDIISKMENKMNYNFKSQEKLNNIEKITNKKDLKFSENNDSNFDYNYKVGLNAPLSYNDNMNNSSNREEKNNSRVSKINLKKNIDKNKKLNLLNENNRKEQKNKNNPKGNKKIDYNIFLNIDEKNLDLNNNKMNNNCNNHEKQKSYFNNNNKVIKGIFYKQIINNYSQIYSNKLKLRKDVTKENNINKNEMKILNNSNNYINVDEKKYKKNIKNNNTQIKIVNNSSKKKDNLGIFEKILIDLKYVKSAINKNNKNIVYNISNSRNYIKINNNLSKANNNSNTNFIQNDNKQSKNPKKNDSKLSSNSISIDYNDINSSRTSTKRIKIKNTYNLAKKCTDKKNKLLNKNNLKSTSKRKINIKEKIIEAEKNENKIEKSNNENNMEINSESVSDNNSSKSDNNNEEYETENNNEVMINNQNNNKIQISQNYNNKDYLVKVFESRKQMSNNNENSNQIPGVNVYNRSQIYKTKSKIKTQNLRKKLEEKEFAEITNTPKINDKSKEISKYNLPIYERLDDIELKKQHDLKRIKDLIIKENEINETTINQKCDKNFNKKQFDKWLLSNDNWNKQKNSKMEKIKDILNQQKLKEENFKFKPTINKNSEKLFNNNEKLSKSPVVERLYKNNSKKEFFSKNDDIKKELSFIPEINKGYKISEQYYNFMEEDQAELYNELKDQVEKEEKNKFYA